MANGHIENIVRVHLTLLRAVGAPAVAQVSNDWLSNHVGGHEVGIPDGETLIARVVRNFVELRDAGLDGVNPTLNNLEKLLLYSKSFATHIDTAMKNGPGANNVPLNGNVKRGLFLLTGKAYIGEEAYREYAEVF